MTQPTEAVTDQSSEQWFTLAVLLLGQLMGLLDVFVLTSPHV